jgi:hypothetical protein
MDRPVSTLFREEPPFLAHMALPSCKLTYAGLKLCQEKKRQPNIPFLFLTFLQPSHMCCSSSPKMLQYSDGMTSVQSLETKPDRPAAPKTTTIKWCWGLRAVRFGFLANDHVQVVATTLAIFKIRVNARR